MSTSTENEDSYFGNTSTPEEDKLLAELPADEARMLAREIMSRTRARFKGVEDRLAGDPEDLFKGFSRPKTDEDPEWLKD